MNVLCPISLNPAMTTCSDRKPRPLVVELAAGYRHECLEVRRREQADGFFRRDDRQAPKGVSFLKAASMAKATTSQGLSKVKYTILPIRKPHHASRCCEG